LLLLALGGGKKGAEIRDLLPRRFLAAALAEDVRVAQRSAREPVQSVEEMRRAVLRHVGG